MPQILKMLPHERIALAVSGTDPNKLIGLVEPVIEHVGLVKLGHEVNDAIIATLMSKPFGDDEGIKELFKQWRRFFNLIRKRLFMDVKLTDIPDTVEKAIKALLLLEPRLINLMGNTGVETLKRAAAVRGSTDLAVVTVLTSMDADECLNLYGDEPKTMVKYFADKAIETGLQAIICSGQELSIFNDPKEAEGIGKLIRIVPGVRSPGVDKGDQSRVVTPEEAIRNGADYLVIGRQIYGASNPVEAAKQLAGEIEAGLKTA